MVDILLEEAAKQGYVPDASVAGDEVINGARPNPFMVYRNLDLLNVTPIQAVVKVPLRSTFNRIDPVLTG